MLISSLLCAVIGSGPTVEEYTDCTQVSNVTLPASGGGTEFITYLGKFDNTEGCINACVGTTTSRCYSYTYFSTGKNAMMCYGRFGEAHGKVWFPVPHSGSNCGRVIYPCTSDADCNYNGACEESVCKCSPAWSGPTCQKLELLPATRNTGYNRSSVNTSSWGGSVIVDRNSNDSNTKYHMFLSEMDNHCGVNTWWSNSVVTHAQSTNGFNSRYEKKEVLRGHFTHEPNAMRGPNGEIAMFYSAIVNATDRPAECDKCVDGSTPPSCPKKNLPKQEVLAFSEGFSGPWTTCVVFKNRTDPLNLVDDTNLSGVVLPNGSFVGVLRHWNNSFDGSQMHVVTAPNWKDCDSYQIQTNELFPELPKCGTEDPHLYRDCQGRFHAIFHNMAPNFDHAVVGGHGYSLDGITWTYSGSIYNDTVHFTDGSQFSFIKRARPHFILDDDDCTILALTNGVVYGGEYGDASLTLLQPVRTDEN